MKTKTYQVVETGKGIRTTYIRICTEEEMTRILKAKNEMNGYIPGIGGDRTYSAVAWSLTEDGHGYIDLDRIWSLYGKQ